MNELAETRSGVRSPDGSHKAEPPSRGMPATVEAVAKASALLLGLLYVFGLLVSNAHAMQLGISDFGGLQARYVTVGFLFALYVLLLASILLMPTFLLLGTMRMRKEHSVLLWAGGLVGALILLVCSAWFVGDVVGYLSPTGKPWVIGTRYVFEPGVSFAQLADAYAYPSILAGALGIGCATMGLFASRRLKLLWAPNERLLLGFVLAFGFPCLLFGYSANAYPNMRYNLGGGSPQVWEVQLDSRLSSQVKMLGLTVTSSDLATVMVGPLAIWHQSDGFVYMTQLDESRSVALDVCAIAVDDIQSFRVLRVSVRLNRNRTLSISSP